jgi:AbrB family looped-hinge helix DNA binding protein
MVAPTPRKAGPSLTRMSSKGQVVIPKDVRNSLGWKSGDTLLVEQADDAIIIRIEKDEDAALREKLFGPPVPLDEITGSFAHLLKAGSRPARSNRNMREAARVAFADR